jgi:hypothetical protein
MLRRAAAFLVALESLAAPARAADAPAAHWKYDNPFCRVLARVAPAPDGSSYALALFAAGGTALDAHVTLVGDTDAYDAHAGSLALNGPPDDRQSPAMLLKLPDNAPIRYFFVDSYTLDGKSVTCPSYVFSVRNGALDVMAGAPTIEASHLARLGSLTCGRVYMPPQMHGDLQSAVGDYGGEPLTVTARAYIDSNGYSIREEIVQSSGVAGLDSYMLGAVGVHQFTPAHFLCVPVVGTTEIELKYFP